MARTQEAHLACLLNQAGSGLFANDDIFTEGPLNGLVEKDTRDQLTALHQMITSGARRTDSRTCAILPA